MIKKIAVLSGLVITMSISFFQKQNKQYKIRTIAFYNLENLFDTINNPEKNDEASPIMEMQGDRSKVYWDKIGKLAEVISQIGTDKAKTAPAIIGVAEVENRDVLEDLVKSEKLKSIGYEIIHYESPDKRGIDVALLYQPRYFKPIHHESFNPNIYDGRYKIKTRDQLLVSGHLDDELIHIIVNHWPSRRGGEQKTRPHREKAAYQNLKIIEQLEWQEKSPKVFIMGDFNDDPINSSFKNVLQTKANKKDVKEGDLYNPYERMFKKGHSTLGHKDNLNLFDQIVISSSVLDKGEKEYSSYKMFKAAIFNKRFLTTKNGRFKGYPLRSFSYSRYTGGYSDHYPVYLYLIKEH